MNLAPIIVFNYNRPTHSKQTWDALSKNLYAKESLLFLYCDGVKQDSSEINVQAVNHVQQSAREFAIDAIENHTFKDVSVICSDINQGLANSIISGVSAIIEKYGKVIVLEDDIITSPCFLKYMNEALDYYSDRKSVFSIGADKPTKLTIPQDYKYDVFVSLRSCSWGWGTWSDRWNQVDWSMNYLSAFINDKSMIEAFNRGGDDLTEMLVLQNRGKIDSWSIRFSYAHFFQHSVAILPCNSYIKNIGLDGTGTHCGKVQSPLNNNIKNVASNPLFLETLYEDRQIINNFANVYCKKKRPIWQKACNFIARSLRLPQPFVLKKKIYF